MFDYLVGALLGDVGGIDFLAHGCDLGVGGDDAIDLGLLEVVLLLEADQFLGESFVGQFHIDY